MYERHFTLPKQAREAILLQCAAMNREDILQELISERDPLTAAIAALEGTNNGTGRSVRRKRRRPTQAVYLLRSNRVVGVGS